jgi:hypothetical protein
VAEAPQPVVEEVKPVEPTAQVVAPAAVAPTPTVEAVVPAVPVSPELIESLVEEELEEEEEEGGKGLGKKKEKKAKARKLVFDERRGAVVAKRERKPGRVRNVWDAEEEA